MRDKQRVRQPQGSIIDKLIEEALFEFTSLKEDSASQAGVKVSPAGSPLNAEQFVDPTNWAEEISHGGRPVTGGYDAIRASLPGEIFEQGNLSMLEDEPAASSGPVAVARVSRPLGGSAPSGDHASLPSMAPRPMSLPP